MDETVTVSRMQAVEFAKAIVEARDEEFAFVLQIQEIVKSTATGTASSSLLERGEEGDGDEEAKDPQFLVKDSLTPSDADKGTALTLAVDELGRFVAETDETQLSLLEAARLAHLDAIAEHDMRFARSLANMPNQAWNRTGPDAADPFAASSNPPPEPVTPKELVDEYESALTLLEDAAAAASKRSRHNAPKNDDTVRVMQRARLVLAPLTIREGAATKCVLGAKELKLPLGKGKGKMAQEEEDDSFPASTLSPKPCPRNPVSLAPELERESENGDAEVDVNGGDCGVKICQICFENTQTTSSFVTFEGCGHQFCETCVSRHASARIQSGALDPCITCLHINCRALVPYTQLSHLLPSGPLEILTRRQIEAAIPEAERVYCPFQDCSALLIRPLTRTDKSKPSTSAENPQRDEECVECEACHRAFCVACEVPWHGDLSCGEYQANLKNVRMLGDEKVLELAKAHKWQRCRKCRRLVELSTGCFHMTCLCKNEFCYSCGESWPGGGKACSCPRWTESRLYQS